jgi:hypothetical protein
MEEFMPVVNRKSRAIPRLKKSPLQFPQVFTPLKDGVFDTKFTHRRMG